MGEWVTTGPESNRAYLVTPEDGSGPGILMLHAWWGLTLTIMKMCDRLASEGYVVLAPVLYPDGETTSSIAEAGKLVEKYSSNLDVVERILLAAADRLQELPAVTGGRIGVVGFSFGASWALHLSQIRPEDVDAVVVFYGASGGDFSEAQAAYLGHFAEHDDYTSRWTASGSWSPASVMPAVR